MNFPNLLKLVNPVTAYYRFADTGSTWTNTSTLLDTGWPGYFVSTATTGSIPIGGYSRLLSLRLSGAFDYLPDDDDVVSLTLTIRSDVVTQAGTSILAAAIANDNGFFLSFPGNSTFTQTLVSPVVTANGTYNSQYMALTNIKASVLKDPTLEIRLSFWNSSVSTAARTVNVERVYVVARTTKKAASVDYTTGLDIRDSTGVSMLGPYGTFTRHVATIYKDNNFSGTISVPNFDDTKGTFVINWSLEKHGLNSAQVAKTVGWETTPAKAVMADSTDLPTLNWNNTTKLLTVTPNPSAWANTTEITSGYHIVFLHYR